MRTVENTATGYANLSMLELMKGDLTVWAKLWNADGSYNFVVYGRLCCTASATLCTSLVSPFCPVWFPG
jgi:hypothetical protein